MMNIYKLPIVFTAQTAQVDLAEIVAPATHSVRIHRIYIAQTTEVADAAEEMLRLNLNFGATTSGSGGNSVTAIPLFLGATAFGGTCETHNTTKATAGTIVTPELYAWNVRVPFDNIYTPETRPRIAPSERSTLELATTPADSVTLGGFITFSIE
jgi:hypothetical protein